MYRRFISACLLALFLTHASIAYACPMCKSANEADDKRPQAYMYSILFMLAMPVALFTSFGVGFYRLSKKQEPLLADGDAVGSAIVEEAGSADQQSL